MQVITLLDKSIPHHLDTGFVFCIVFVYLSEVNTLVGFFFFFVLFCGYGRV